MIAGNMCDEQASGEMPIFEKGVVKVADDEAYTTSQCGSIVTPTPTAGPFTTAKIGFGKFMRHFTKFLAKT